MKFFIVDAFTDNIFGGNPAGVVILPEGGDFPEDETMRKTAAELRYSETAFIKQLGPNEFNIRYFTPAAEVELCGHATIGSFKVLNYLGLVKDGTAAMNHTLSGDLNIELKSGGVLMDMAAPVKIGEITEKSALEELYSIMGLDWNSQSFLCPKCGKALDLIPQMVSTGLPDIMMPVSDLKELDAVSPDFPALARLSERYGVVGVHAFTLDRKPGEECTCHVRNFAPLYDIDEEAATGTSNGALTYYGLLNGFVKSGDDCKFIQGEKMDRPSAICSHIEVTADGKCAIQVGGNAVILAEGEINL